MVELCQYACIHVPDSITVNHEETTVFQHLGQLETILYVYLWCASFYSTGMHISMVVVIEGGKLLEEIYIYIYTATAGKLVKVLPALTGRSFAKPIIICNLVLNIVACRAFCSVWQHEKP